MRPEEEEKKLLHRAALQMRFIIRRGTLLANQITFHRDYLGRRRQASRFVNAVCQYSQHSVTHPDPADIIQDPYF